MPIFPIFDLAITDEKLVAGSFARGIYTFDLSQLGELNNKEVVVQNDLEINPTISSNQIKIEWKDGNKSSKFEIISSTGRKIFEGQHSNGDLIF